MAQIIRKARNVPPGMNDWIGDVEKFLTRLAQSTGQTGSETPIVNKLRPVTEILSAGRQVLGRISAYEDNLTSSGFRILGQMFFHDVGFTIMEQYPQPLEGPNRIFSITSTAALSAGSATFSGAEVNFTGIPTTASSASAHLTPSGRLYRVTSTRASKADIEAMAIEDAREILRLNPVTFRSASQPDGPRIVGLIAEEVDEATSGGVLNALIGRDENGEVDSVHYDRVMLPVLVVARDHDNRIAALEEEVETLKAIVERLINGADS